MDSKISELDLVSVVDQNDVLPIVNGGITKKVKVSQLVQDLQSVTDKGATTTNSIIVETVFPNADTAISGISLSGEGVYGSSSETNGVHGSSQSGAGVYGESNDGAGVYGESNNTYGVHGVSISGVGVYGQSDNVGVGVYGQSDNVGVVGFSDLGTGVYANSASGKPIETYGNGNNTPSIEVNLGNTNKGVVVESGVSSTGNPIEVKKNGVLKFRVAQNGDVTTDVIIANGDVLTLEAGPTKIEINDVDTEISIIAGNFNVNCPISTTLVNANQYRLAALNTAPAGAIATGTLGEIRYTADFIYVCIATNIWRRTALTSW